MSKFSKFSVISFCSLLLVLPVINNYSTEPIHAKADSFTLKIYNWEDYIYEPEKDGEEQSIIEQYEKDYKQRTGNNVKVEYYTFTTNEEMYNSIQLSGAQYDLLVPSDYMIERLKREEMLEKFDYNDETGYKLIDNFDHYASSYLKNLFIENSWHEYAVGYMWGTMGIIYNTEVTDSEDMSTWDVLWNQKYHKSMTIKDSMREGYLIGLLHVYQDELQALKIEHQENKIDDHEYNRQINELLNDVSPEAIEKVGKALDDLKHNIYGTEVDSGKNDIVKGRISINSAWSGDAVYSIYEAANTGKDVLRYKVPEEGSNIWYDAFVMPKGANKELAQDFINFVSAPSIAVLNMDYIGYTTFIAGDEVLEYVLDYDEVLDEGDGHDVDLTYFFENTLSEERSIDEAVFKVDYGQVGGQLTTQFPSYQEIIRIATMRDFGDAEKAVIEMWATFKATNAQTWMYVFGGGIILSLIGLSIYQLVVDNKSSRRRRRKKYN